MSRKETDTGNRRKRKWDSTLCPLSQGKSPTYGPPQEVAKYSTELRTEPLEETPSNACVEADVAKFTMQQPYQRTLCADNMAHCRRLVNALPPYDLKVGCGSQIEKKRENEFMSLLLKCLVRDGLVGRSKFVSGRGVLTSVSATPYDSGGRFDKGMIVAVQRIGGVFYMYDFDTVQQRVSMDSRTDVQKEMSYWGRKFESYVTAQPDEKQPRPEDPMNFNHDFCTVVKTKVGSHEIITRGEIDCCRSDGRYIELKTNKEFMKGSFDEQKLRKFKFIKWWLQSSLVGVKDILCGFRDDNGIVKSVKWYKVDDLPTQMVGCDTAVCLNYLDEFLTQVKAKVKSDFVPHVFHRQPGSKQFQMKVDEEGEYKFIPLWFACRK